MILIAGGKLRVQLLDIAERGRYLGLVLFGAQQFRSAFPDREDMERRLKRIPLGRMGTVAEIVSLVLYLASDDSAYMTGSELLIDGGALAQ